MNKQSSSSRSAIITTSMDLASIKKAFSDWYNAAQNKKIISHMSLLTWIFLMTLILTILPLTATSENRMTFYLPLIVFIPLLYGATYWLLVCFQEASLASNPHYTTVGIHDCNAPVLHGETL